MPSVLTYKIKRKGMRTIKKQNVDGVLKVVSDHLLNNLFVNHKTGKLEYSGIGIEITASMEPEL